MIQRFPLHFKCRNSIYPKSTIQRYPVPDEKISWNIEWPQYSPINYVASAIINKPWADPSLDDCNFKPKWNAFDNNVNRKSHFTVYNILNGVPLNPIGRTGIIGRGCLGRWGPNHAADPILTRWKRNSDNTIEHDEMSKKPILQFVAIERRDSHEWAIPGGMVDPGETVSDTLKREFLEEALDVLSVDKAQREEKKKLIEKVFINGLEIYKGYVDDPRNTDNAWMETVVTNFHDEDGYFVNQINLSAGDDAVNVKWLDLNSKLVLYASHRDFIAQVAKIKNSHW